MYKYHPDGKTDYICLECKSTEEQKSNYNKCTHLYAHDNGKWTACIAQGTPADGGKSRVLSKDTLPTHASPAQVDRIRLYDAANLGTAHRYLIDSTARTETTTLDTDA